MLMRTLLRAALVISAVVVVACGGGGGGGLSVATGSVAVQITDGPVSAGTFSSILVTFTEIVLIGETRQISIFEGRETLDLRDLEDVGKLVTVGRDVPAGKYEKIRLDIEDIELVPADGSPSIHPKLPPKLDLNPRESFWVHPGKMLFLQIDFDAGKSVHIVLTGNGGYRFRPVAFVEVLSGPSIGKLVLLQGAVEELDRTQGIFLLCDTDHGVSRPFGGDRATRYDRNFGDLDDTDDFCVEVGVFEDTSIFDKNGDPAGLDAVENGDEASVLGRFAEEPDEDLVFDALVIQLGPPGTTRAIDGEVLGDVDNDARFLLAVDPGQGFTAETELLVALQEGAKVFSRHGLPLGIGDIEPGIHVRVVGLLELSVGTDRVKASVVAIDLDAMSLERVSGSLISLSSDLSRLELDTDTGRICVDLNAVTRVFAASKGDRESQFTEIDRSELMPGDEIDVYGVSGTCFQARTVIAFFEEGS